MGPRQVLSMEGLNSGSWEREGSTSGSSTIYTNNLL